MKKTSWVGFTNRQRNTIFANDHNIYLTDRRRWKIETQTYFSVLDKEGPRSRFTCVSLLSHLITVLDAWIERLLSTLCTTVSYEKRGEKRKQWNEVKNKSGMFVCTHNNRLSHQENQTNRFACSKYMSYHHMTQMKLLGISCQSRSALVAMIFLKAMKQ